jgi:uncharacterized protein (TIGR03089 family)
VETAGGAFQSFTALAERQPGRYGDKPFLTWYDDDRDQRVELSYKTFDNWVAKVANLLVDELGAGPGDRVATMLVDHWQTAVVLAACWRAGAGVVAVDPDADEAALAATLGAGGVAAAFVREERAAAAAGVLAAAPAGLPVVALTADLAGRSAHDLGAARNFTRVVPSMGDLFATPADPQGEALRAAPAAGAAATMGELLGEAARLAGGTGLHDRDRLLSGLPLLTPSGAAAGLLAPFGCGAGVVLASAFEPARFWKRVADERVTVAALSPAQAASVLVGGPPPEDLDRSRLRAVTCPAAPVPEELRTGFRDRLGVPMLPDG